MQIESITVEGFKCFKSKKKIVFNNRLSCFVGVNGAGKTAVLEAISRIFGVKPSDKGIKKSDFHVELGKRFDEKDKRYLSIELNLTFPELAEGSENSSVANFFEHVIIEKQGEIPHCKIRLEATWEKSNTPEGILDEKLLWILQDDDGNPKTHDVNRYDRNNIHFYYIPATRDPLKEIKQTSNSMMYRLLNDIHCSEEEKDKIAKSTNEIIETFENLNGIKEIKDEFQEYWNKYSNSDFYKNLSIKPINNDFEDILKKTDIYLSPSVSQTEENINVLSDGLKSLFYFTIINSIFSIENKRLTKEYSGFDNTNFIPPSLTIFAIEEPENHLSPHFIARIIKIFREILDDTNRAQVLITSHSPSILKRIAPEEILHFHLDYKRESEISKILLPDKEDEAFKYVKEAVKAYPELYFSKLVVLGEGDSEEIIIPKVANAFDIELDTSFVSFVPLGGRHVNHFWRLLNQIKIPYITLLDYDKGRKTGGEEKIEYILKQLLKNGKFLKLKDSDEPLSDEELKKLTLTDDQEDCWIKHLETNFETYFSYEIDIDFLMLEHYFDNYEENSSGKPRIPKEDNENYEKKCKEAIASVYKKDKDKIEDINNYKDIKYYFWYRYLFLGSRGKPFSHMITLSELNKNEIKANCPPVLKSLVYKIDEKINENN